MRKSERITLTFSIILICVFLLVDEMIALVPPLAHASLAFEPLCVQSLDGAASSPHNISNYPLGNKDSHWEIVHIGFIWVSFVTGQSVIKLLKQLLGSDIGHRCEPWRAALDNRCLVAHWRHGRHGGTGAWLLRLPRLWLLT